MRSNKLHKFYIRIWFVVLLLSVALFEKQLSKLKQFSKKTLVSMNQVTDLYDKFGK